MYTKIDIVLHHFGGEDKSIPVSESVSQGLKHSSDFNQNLCLKMSYFDF